MSNTTNRPVDFTGFIIAAVIVLVWAFGVSGCAREMPRDDLSWRILRDHNQHHEWRHDR